MVVEQTQRGITQSCKGPFCTVLPQPLKLLLSLCCQITLFTLLKKIPPFFTPQEKCSEKQSNVLNFLFLTLTLIFTINQGHKSQFPEGFLFIPNSLFLAGMQSFGVGNAAKAREFKSDNSIRVFYNKPLVLRPSLLFFV